MRRRGGSGACIENGNVGFTGYAHQCSIKGVTPWQVKGTYVFEWKKVMEDLEAWAKVLEDGVQAAVDKAT